MTGINFAALVEDILHLVLTELYAGVDDTTTA